MFEQMERNAGGWFSSKEIKSKVSIIMLAPRPNISLLAFYLLELVLHLNVPTTISKCKKKHLLVLRKCLMPNCKAIISDTAYVNAFFAANYGIVLIHKMHTSSAR